MHKALLLHLLDVPDQGSDDAVVPLRRVAISSGVHDPVGSYLYALSAPERRRGSKMLQQLQVPSFEAIAVMVNS